MNTSPLRNNLTFFITLTVYWLFQLLLLLIHGYKDSFLLLNSLHFSALDYPMFVLTHLGDPLIITSLLALLLSGRNPQGVLYIIVAVTLTGLFGQLLKNTFFEGWDRPLQVFREIAGVHTVAGYKMYHNSFPSGHSIVVAAAITAAMLISKTGIWIQVSAALFVALVSYTRTYVGVHFPGDVLTGTLIGSAGAILLFRPVYGNLIKRNNSGSDSRKGRTVKTLHIIAVVSFVLGIYLIAESLS